MGSECFGGNATSKFAPKKWKHVSACETYALALL
jgi:hypothetical protein